MNQPLQGQRIVVTRGQEQSQGLTERLVELGAEVILFPTLQFVPLWSEELAAAKQHLSTYDWLLFTSRNAVKFFFADGDPLPHLPRIAAVGPATAAELAHRGLDVHTVPDTFTAENLVAELGDLAGQNVLIPRSRLGKPEIVAQLRAQGAEVTGIALYDTIPAQPEPEAVQALAQGCEAITFTSPSTVYHFCQMVPDWPQWLSEAVVVCIGSVTADAAAQRGLAPLIIAEEHTTAGLINILIKTLGNDKHDRNDTTN